MMLLSSNDTLLRDESGVFIVVESPQMVKFNVGEATTTVKAIRTMMERNQHYL